MGQTMTRQKSLKALVRGRMAQTEETYTTARRHVVAQRTYLSPFPSAVLPGDHHDERKLTPFGNVGQG
jgi:hypothetical protein